jgi:hypothetical protein
MAVYDTTSYNGRTGWFVVGGTSASAPMIAARSAVRAGSGGVVDASTIYSSGFNVRDIVSGSNGAPCGVGYDLCTGRGSWSDVTLGGSPPPAPSATSFTVTSPSGTSGYSLARGKRDLVVTITLRDDKGGAVAGANVTYTLHRVGGSDVHGSATTGSTGSATFKYSNAPSGEYSTTVGPITNTGGLSWDESTPDNLFSKTG